MSTPSDKKLRDIILETMSTIPDPYLCQLLIDTYGRHDYHFSIAKRNHVFFRNSHYVLVFLIPIYSAFFTYIVSNDLIRSPSVLGAMGLVLTILTIVSSILKPYERCIAAGDVLIVLSDWKTDLMIGLGNIQAKPDENQQTWVYEFLKQKDLEMSKIGEAMMENLILRSSINVQPNAENK